MGAPHGNRNAAGPHKRHKRPTGKIHLGSGVKKLKQPGVRDYMRELMYANASVTYNGDDVRHVSRAGRRTIRRKR